MPRDSVESGPSISNAINFRAFLALRAPIAVAAIVLWNLFLFVGGAMGGGRGVGSTMAIYAATTFGLSAFALGVVFVEGFRSAVVSPRRQHLYLPEPYFLLGVVCASLCAVCLAAALWGLR